MFGIKKKAAAEPAEAPPASAQASTASSSAAGGYAGFWLRVLALFADTAILFFASFVIAILASFAGDMGAMAAGGIIVLANLLYWVVMHASQRQATFGKAMVGIIVTDKDGNSISMLRSLGRELAKLISMLPMGIGFLIAAFTGKKQALHDLIASTLVVRDGDAHIARTVVVAIVGYAVPIIAIPLFGLALFAGLAASFMGDMAGEMKKGGTPPAMSAKPAAPKPPAPPAVATPGAAPGATVAAPAAGPAPAAGAPAKPAAAPTAPPTAAQTAAPGTAPAAASAGAAPAADKSAPAKANATVAAAPAPAAAPKLEVPPDEPEAKAPRRRAPRTRSAPAGEAAPKAAATAEAPPAAAETRPSAAPPTCVYKPVMTDEEIAVCRRR